MRNYSSHIETTQLHLVTRATRTVVNRINFPKVLAGKMGRTAALRAKSRPLLSPHDEEEVGQTCALALVASGALDRCTLNFGDWKACFRAARSKACLRIETGHAKADATDIATLHKASAGDAIGCAIGQFFRVDRALEVRRACIARRVRYMRACIVARFEVDPSRQRSHNRTKAMRYLRYLASQFSSGQGEVEILDASTPEAAYMARNRFEKYIAAGEIAIDASESARFRARFEDTTGALKSFAAI